MNFDISPGRQKFMFVGFSIIHYFEFMEEVQIEVI